MDHSARMLRPVALLALLSLLAPLTVTACTKDEKSAPTPSKTAEAGASSATPKSLDLAKAALVTAKAKYARHEVVDADCAPIKSLEADFAQDKSPEAVKATREIDVFCDIDVKLEGAVATLKGDHEKLTAAQKKKDRPTEQMYGATVKDGCTSIREQLASLASSHLDTEPKVATLKADVERICR